MGNISGKKTHGYCTTKKLPTVYSSWRGMRQRCLNPKGRHYAHYGARGISICPQWNKFSQFLADMGEPPPGRSLDRIDNNGNYKPGNCRWATKSEQVSNRRPYITPKARGAENVRSVLTWAQAAEIRSLAGTALHREIAVRFGVSRPTVSRVIRGDAYKVAA